MPQTTHTVHAGSGRDYRVRINHDEHAAVQYEFYIPEAIWSHASVQAFIMRLQAVVPGATVFGGLGGVWQGQPETTRICRLIVRADQFDMKNTRAALRGEIGRLMAELSVSPEQAQQTFMVTETDVRATMAGGLTRI